jgi:hypothetical protein
MPVLSALLLSALPLLGKGDRAPTRLLLAAEGDLLLLLLGWPLLTLLLLLVRSS